jgi:hypothetical protein
LGGRHVRRPDPRGAFAERLAALSLMEDLLGKRVDCVKEDLPGDSLVKAMFSTKFP